MKFLLSQRKFLSVLLVFNFLSLTVGFYPVHATMIPTAQVLKANQLDSDREKLNAFLERKDVQQELGAWGLDKDMAKARLASLTDEEVSRMAEQLDQLPAGGDAVGTIVGAAVLVFLILLITDILGYTDVFPFTR